MVDVFKRQPRILKRSELWQMIPEPNKGASYWLKCKEVQTKRKWEKDWQQERSIKVLASVLRDKMKKAKIQGILTPEGGVVVYKMGFYKCASSKKDRQKCRYITDWRTQQWITWGRPNNTVPFVHHSSQKETSSCINTVGKDRSSQFWVCSDGLYREAEYGHIHRFTQGYWKSCPTMTEKLLSVIHEKLWQSVAVPPD